MKKYNTPELTISSFDVEDIITASGEVVNDINAYVDTFVTDGSNGATQQVYATGAYFAWNAH